MPFEATRRGLCTAALGLSAVAALSPAVAKAADVLPPGNVRIVVPIAPGGPLDALARLVADRLRPELGRAVVVENVSGAGGNLGAATAARARPDGLTWLLALDTTFTVNPHLFRSMGFDWRTGLTPLTLAGDFPQALVAHPGVGARTLPELVAASRRAELTYASAGIGSPGHLAFEYLKMATGIRAAHVPYRGAAPAVTDLVGGQVQVAFVVAASVLQHVQEGRLVPVAVSGAERLPGLPETPTVAEVGHPGFLAPFGFVAMVPSGTPEDARRLIGERIRSAFESPEVRERLSAIGIEPTTSTADEAARWLRQEVERWSAVVKASGMRAD